MKGHGTKFTQKMEKAVAALLKERNLEDAAKAVGISVATLMRWQKLPEFDEAYREGRRQILNQAIYRLQQTTGAAVSALQKLLIDQATPASVKARVAIAIIDQAFKGMEAEEKESCGGLTHLHELVEMAKRGPLPYDSPKLHEEPL